MASSATKARICIVTGTHLCQNPRLVKEARTLAATGYDVTVLAHAFMASRRDVDDTLRKRATWRIKRVIDPTKADARYVGLQHRLRTQAARSATRWLRLQSSEALGYGIRATLCAARAEQGDLYIAHQEVGSWIGTQLLRDGARVAADIEDWYSEDLLPESRKSRPRRLLRECEETLLCQAAYTTTTSHALAEQLGQRYGAPEPAVVYNAFPWSDRQSITEDRLVAGERPDGRARPSLYWFSQSIGRGRGLEHLMRALPRLAGGVELHLRGKCTEADAAWLRSALTADGRHSLYLHDLVPPDQLLPRLAQHTLGLALEESTSPNKDLTVSNKIMHYLFGGLPVVATETAGQRELAAAAPGAVVLCRVGDAESLASGIDGFLTSPERLETGRTAALAASRNRFCWEEQRKVVLDCAQRALKGPADATHMRRHPAHYTPPSGS